MRVGVEVGGTFTDLVAVEGGRVVVTKVPSTPRSPDVGAFAALTASGIDLARIEDLGHGSTVATNAVLERKGASVAFVATAGFRDLLFMQRHDRRNIYDLFYAKPAPPVRRKDCFEAPERITRRRLDREAARRGGGEERADPGPQGRRLSRRRDLPAQCLCQSRAREAAGGADHRGAARRAGDGEPSGGARVPRVRARLDDAAVGLRAAGDRRLPASLREQARRVRLQGPLHGDAVQRRAPAGRGDARKRHHRALFRSGRRRGRRHAPGRALGLRRPHHLRHGRHLDRRLPGAGRPALARLGKRDRRPADPHAGARHRLGRRGRRLDRLGRRRRHAAGRPAKRRRRSRPGLLRQGRHRARHDRRPHRHRHHPARRLPGRPHESRRRGGAARLRAAGRSASASASSRPPPRRCSSPTPTSCAPSSSSRPSAAAIRATMPWCRSAARARCMPRASPRSSASRPSSCRPMPA